MMENHCISNVLTCTFLDPELPTPTKTQETSEITTSEMSYLVPGTGLA